MKHARNNAGRRDVSARLPERSVEYAVRIATAVGLSAAFDGTSAFISISDVLAERDLRVFEAGAARLAQV